MDQSGISCEVVNCRFIKPMDEAYLKSIIGKFDNVVTIEEGVRAGGFGEAVVSWLSSNGYKGKTQIISLPNEYVEHGPRDVLLEQWGVSQAGIIKAIKSNKKPTKLEV